MQVQPLGESPSIIPSGVADLKMNLGRGKEPYVFCCYVTDKICDQWPPLPLDIPKILGVQRQNLADPKFDQPGPVDILVGNHDFHPLQGSHSFLKEPCSSTTPC